MQLDSIIDEAEHHLLLVLLAQLLRRHETSLIVVPHRRRLIHARLCLTEGRAHPIFPLSWLLLGFLLGFHELRALVPELFEPGVVLLDATDILGEFLVARG